MMKCLLLFLAAAALSLGADITGTWNFNVETDMGSGTPTMTFKPIFYTWRRKVPATH